MMMDRIALRLLNIRRGVTLPNTYILLFVEEQGHRTLPVVINKKEAMQLINTIESCDGLLNIMHEVTSQYQIEVNEIILHYDKVNGFFAYLFFVRDGLLKHTRTTVVNAVFIAQKFGCLVHIKRELFEQKHDPDADPDKVALPLSQLDSGALEHLLDDALMKEDYELAANVRDELERRKANYSGNQR